MDQVMKQKIKTCLPITRMEIQSKFYNILKELPLQSRMLGQMKSQQLPAYNKGNKKLMTCIYIVILI